ncbi:DUF6247 family protein [Nonomuraea roseoviolacea]|uniref:DUF6247 family protein n=1 Tax=Nonomuraea roseoviolacea TaxID=103837 RepID=UPI0031E47498
MVAPEDHEAFDAGFKAVLDEVRVSLEFGALNAFVHRWWIFACDTAKEQARRRGCTDFRPRLHGIAGRRSRRVDHGMGKTCKR